VSWADITDFDLCGRCAQLRMREFWVDNRLEPANALEHLDRADDLVGVVQETEIEHVPLQTIQYRSPAGGECFLVRVALSRPSVRATMRPGESAAAEQ
jgi:hypothetical protein